jgi:hypothetical protein
MGKVALYSTLMCYIIIEMSYMIHTFGAKGKGQRERGGEHRAKGKGQPVTSIQ